MANKNTKAKSLPYTKHPLREFFSAAEFKKLEKEVGGLDLMAAASWQDPDNFAANSVAVDEPFVYFEPLTDVESKDGDPKFKVLQKKCFSAYKTFGPLNASVDSKSNYVVGPGFRLFSSILDINEFLKDLFYSTRNKLWLRIIGWMIRMQAEGELFLLLVFDDFGTATVRALEPGRIGDGEETGLITDPDDWTQTLFYHYKSDDIDEWIPDVRFILEGEYMTERQKALGDDFEKDKIEKITKGKGKGAKNMGGYRRFVIHWKNLSGILEYQRDTSSLTTTLEWINLYTKAIKWELDYKKALSSYTIEISFMDSAAGKVANAVWQKMTAKQKAATGLTTPLTPGSRVFTLPGIEIEIHSPQLSAAQGGNQEIMDLAGASAKTPQDMWQGQSGSSTNAAIKSTRPPMQAEIESLQHLFKHFFIYEFLRPCMKAKTLMGGKIMTALPKSKYKLEESYKKDWVGEIKKGKGKVQQIDVEPIEMVEVSLPVVKLVEEPDKSINAALGSKHGGLISLGVSRETVAKMNGVHNLNDEVRKAIIEDEILGPIKQPAPDTETKPGNNKGAE